MQKLRSIHLYLGCIFAPMLLFFALSGIWQIFTPGYQRSTTLAWLTTIHTSHGLKAGTLSSPILRGFVIIMAVSFIVSILLGVVMALKHGRSRHAACCLIFGVLFPVMVIVIFHAKSGNPFLDQQQSKSSGVDATIAQLEVAAANGKFDALDQMNALFPTAANRPAASTRGDPLNAFRQAFDDLGMRAGQGNDNAVESLLRAIKLEYLQAFAVEGLGKAAGLGNQRALEPLLHPNEFHILESGAVPALQAAAENGNQKAIEGVAAYAGDSAYGYEVVNSLQKAAAVAGNTTAIDALAVIAKSNQGSEGRLAMTTLELASSNHIAHATEVLHQLTGK